MALPGNSGLTLVAYYAGSPVGVSMATLNIPKGTFVIDTSTPALYQKTSTTDNSTFNTLTNVNSATITGATLVSSIISTGLTASGSAANTFAGSTGTFLTSTGLTTISGPLKFATDTLSGPGAISVTTATTKLTTTGVADALTLANGSDGQIKTIIHDVDGGSAVLTPTTKTGFTTVTFTAVGETVTLQYVTTRGWVILAIVGAVAA